MNQTTTPVLAGRELDVLIAEKVFGLNVVAQDWPCGWMPDNGYQAEHWPNRATHWSTEKGPVYADATTIWPPQASSDPNWGPYTNVKPVPFYSSDIAAAWELVGHLRERQLYLVLNDTLSAWRAVFELQLPPDNYYIAANGPRPHDMARYGFGECPALAICRAALAAIAARNA